MCSQRTDPLRPAFGAASGRTPSSQPFSKAAFTLVELLVVVAVLVCCAFVLLPAMARTQADSRAFQCLNNHAQLCRAWRMYADDNNDRLATNLQGVWPGFPPMWAPGWLDWGVSQDNTNTIYLSDPRYSILARYFGKDARLFKCPADQYVSAVLRARGWNERVRSVSQNIYAADSNLGTGPTDLAYYVHVTKLAALVNPVPAQTWVSIDEHPDSINDGAFFAPYYNSWVDIPANYHDGGAGIAYADGRAEIHRWQTSVLRFPIKFDYVNLMPTPPNDPDLLWLRHRTPRRPGLN